MLCLEALFVDEDFAADFEELRDVLPLLFVVDLVELFVEVAGVRAVVLVVLLDDVLTLLLVADDFEVVVPTRVDVAGVLPVLVDVFVVPVVLFVVVVLLVPVRVVTPVLVVLFTPVVVVAFFDVAADEPLLCFTGVRVVASFCVDVMRVVDELPVFVVRVAVFPPVVSPCFVAGRLVDVPPLVPRSPGENVPFTSLLPCCEPESRLPPMFTVVRVLLSREPCCPPPMEACEL